MKTRVLVMNGQRIVQTDRPKPGEWETAKIDKAGPLRPGIYNVYNALPADKAKATEGPVIHADKDAVYQQVGKAFVKHDRAAFERPPEIGATLSVSYAQNKAVVATPGPKLSRGVAR